MSLINDMLKDLEQRNASSTGATPIAGDVHSVAFSPARSYRWLGLLLILGVLAAGYAFFAMDKTPPKAIQAKAPAPLPAAPAAPAVVPPQPEPQPASPAVAVAPPPADATAAAPAPQSHESDMIYALDRELRTMPASEAAEKPAPAAASAAKREPVNAGAGSENQPASAKPAQTVSKAKASAALPVKQTSPEQRSSNLYRQAVDLMQQGRVSESMEVLQRALETNPANHDARQLLVGELLDAKRNQEAMALLREGLAVDAAQNGFRMALARLQIESGDRQGAMDTMEQGLASAGEDAEYHAFLAQLLQRDERHAEAIQHYLVSLRSNPAMPNWLIGIGISLQAEKMVPDATAAFQRAIDTAQLSPELQQFAEQRLKQLRLQAK